MSQPLTPNPSPPDAAAALANTRAAQPDLTNRREIPVSSFDFLNGAYAATNRARRFTMGLLALVLAVGLFLLVNAVRTGVTASGVRSETSETNRSRSALIEEFGAEASGKSTEEILARDRQLSTAFATIAASQADIGGLLSDLEAIKTEGAWVGGLSFGDAVTFDGESKEAPEGTVFVEITVRGDTIQAVVAMAEQVQGLEALSNVSVTREDLTAVILGTLPKNKPPRAVVERLIDLGVKIKIANSSATQKDDQGNAPATTVPGSSTPTTAPAQNQAAPVTTQAPAAQEGQE